MKETIKELLQEWWAGNATTRMPLPTFYTYEVQVDDKTIQIKSTSRSRIYIHYKVRKMYPDANYISVMQQIRQYSVF